jgi:acetoin utilization protein AcuC
MGNATCVYIGEALASYGFGHGHPFGPDRLDAFWTRAQQQQLDTHVTVHQPVITGRGMLETFHTPAYIDRVIKHSASGTGYLDAGDTPAVRGIYEAACVVVGSVLDALGRVLEGECRNAFVPIAGLHHARRDSAAGFCVFNDCGIAIEVLRAEYDIRRVAYVDIDAHHGDGVFYSFEADPELLFADLHEDGHYLYPGTGDITETGRGEAAGTKLNIPMPPEADDARFFAAWEQAEAFIDRQRPEFILFQCGADSIAGDPITHLSYTPAAHAHAARRLCALAARHCDGRLLAMGGGGYNRDNLARAWCAVLAAMAGKS